MNNKLKNISFHPKFAAGLDVFLGLIFWWWLSSIGIWWVLLIWVLFRLLLWAILVRLSFFPSGQSRLQHFLTLTHFCFGILLLAVFGEWGLSWYLLGALFVTLPVASFWLLQEREVKFLFVVKPYRRLLFFMNAFALAGLWSGVGAIAAFQVFYNISNWLWIVVAAAVSSLVAWWWWTEYGLKSDRILKIWCAAIFIIMIELAWVILQWPLGFFASGLLLIWWWYIIWLMGRFNLTSAGINWKKQKWFLGVNALLMISFLLFLVRWK